MLEMKRMYTTKEQVEGILVVQQTLLQGVGSLVKRNTET